MEQLADSVLGLSDEALMGEVGETGADAEEEAERHAGCFMPCQRHGHWKDQASRVPMIPKQKLSSLKW